MSTGNGTATRPPQPVALSVNPDAIPAELRALDQWVVWRYVWSSKKQKWDKPPNNARTRGLASSTDPTTWSTYATALIVYQKCGQVRNLAGLGVVLTEANGITGIDLDHCRDPQTGRLASWAATLVAELSTYAELSPSGTGVRLFLRGSLSDKGRRRSAAEVYPGAEQLPDQDTPEIEVYDRGRYLTVTGHRLDGAPLAAESRQGQLTELYQRMAPPRKREPQSNGSAAHLADEALLTRARVGPYGAEFARLWSGDASDYDGDSSRADHHLCRHLAYWTAKDAARIDSLFRQSGLYRDKWDRTDYRERTIQAAMAACTSTYQPGRKRAEAAIGPSGAIERDDDPHRLARLYLRQFTSDDGLSLRYWREEWHRWDGAAYREVGDKELRAELVARIKEEFDAIAAGKLAEWKYHAKKSEGEGKSDKEKEKDPPTAQPVTATLLGNALQALASLTILPGRTAAPAWIEPPDWLDVTAPPPPFPAEEVLACRNGLVHLPTLVAGSDRPLAAHTRRYFSLNALDYDFILTAAEPRQWLEFLGALWPSDQQAIDTLQEWFGYCLLPDTRQQKILFIVGPKRSGKGTIARVLRALVGIENTAGPTMAGLGTNFGLQPLLGKTLAIISDARLSGRTDAAVVTERLLSISGEDAQTVDRKNRSQVTVQLPIRFAILTNELPRLNDPSGALISRLIVLRQTRSWFGREDTHLTDRLLAELPGILLWAIRGWQRLRERGHFVQPDSGRELVGDLEDLSSPIGAFIRDRCEVGPAHEIEVKALYEAWRDWCSDKGKKEAGTEHVFGRDLRAALPTLDVRQPRTESGRTRVYVGIGLKLLV